MTTRWLLSFSIWTACLASSLSGHWRTEETGERQAGLDLLALEVVDLTCTELVVDRKLLVGQRKYTRSAAGEILEGFFVILGDRHQHLHDRLGRTLDANKGTS